MLLFLFPPLCLPCIGSMPLILVSGPKIMLFEAIFVIMISFKEHAVLSFRAILVSEFFLSSKAVGSINIAPLLSEVTIGVILSVGGKSALLQVEAIDLDDKANVPVIEPESTFVVCGGNLAF